MYKTLQSTRIIQHHMQGAGAISLLPIGAHCLGKLATSPVSTVSAPSNTQLIRYFSRMVSCAQRIAKFSQCTPHLPCKYFCGIFKNFEFKYEWVNKICREQPFRKKINVDLPQRSTACIHVCRVMLALLWAYTPQEKFVTDTIAILYVVQTFVGLASSMIWEILAGGSIGL